MQAVGFLSDDKLKTHRFIPLNQLYLGSALITNQEECHKMLELLLKSGEHAMNTTSFDEACSHFQLGINLLRPQHWHDELFNGAAKVAFCGGDCNQLDILARVVLDKARMVMHKIKPCTLQMELALTLTNNPKLLKLALKLCSRLNVGTLCFLLCYQALSVVFQP